MRLLARSPYRIRPLTTKQPGPAKRVPPGTQKGFDRRQNHIVGRDDSAGRVTKQLYRESGFVLPPQLLRHNSSRWVGSANVAVVCLGEGSRKIWVAQFHKLKSHGPF